MNLYNKTDTLLHVLSQLLAKAGRTFVPAEDDDSHNNICFDALGNRLTGRWMETKKGNILPTLHLDTLNFELLDTSLNVVSSTSTTSRKLQEVEKEIKTHLSDLGLDSSEYSAKMNYDMPKYDFTDQPTSAIDPEGLRIWKEYRQLANEVCLSLIGHAQTWTEIRIWPHHFDTGVYFKAKNDLGVGFGLAIKDEMVGAPYFYMSAYPEGREIDYNNLPKGNWKWEIGENFKGCILGLPELHKLSTPEKIEQVNKYLETTYKWMIEQ